MNILVGMKYGKEYLISKKLIFIDMLFLVLFDSKNFD